VIESASLFLGFRMLFTAGASQKATRHLIGAILGIALSLVPLITVIEVSGGMIEGITRRFIEIGSYHLQIKSYSPVDREDTDRMLETVLRHPDVIRTHKVILGEGLIYSQEGKTGVSVRSLTEDYYRSDSMIRKYLQIEEGSFDLTDPRNALLSEEVAEKLKVRVGERIRLLTARAVPGRAPILRPSVFTVRGIFSTGYYELDALSMYIPFGTGELLFQEPGSFVLGVKTAQPYEGINRTASQIAAELEGKWMVYTWYGMERPTLESFNTTRNLLIFVMALIVAVAAVNISSSMIMLVLEKEPEIAMLKSMGVGADLITRSFVYTGFFIGFAAVLLGVAVGLTVAININGMIDGLETGSILVLRLISVITEPLGASVGDRIPIFNESYYLETIPIRIEFFEIFLTAMGTLAIATAAAYFPARRAGRLKPLEILRKH